MGKRRVLVIDDNADFCETISTRLRAEGFDVRTAASGQEGLDAVATQAFDVILLDMLMPEKDGVATYQELRANPATKRVPIILLTGVAVEGHWEPMQQDADPLAFVLGKPHDYRTLMARIHQLLAQASGGG
jgi:CheY-like chemotaxis protein